jgi:hypothetical protein
VTINNISFLKETGGDGAAGNIYQWTAYSTAHGNACISVALVLHSLSPGVFNTPPPLYDELAETAVLVEIMSTFAWLPPTPTPTPYIQCTPPVCAIGTSEVYYCPGGCPGGCGTTCATYTPTPSTPVADIGPYAVTHMGINDSLTIYSAAGSANSAVGLFPADAINIMRTGHPAQQAGNSQWVEVRLPDGTGTGWVNSYYLTEYVSSEAFCADTRILPVIDQLKQAMNQSNGEQFASLVSAVHGVDVRLWKYQHPINLTQAQARNVFTSTDIYNWGSGPSGILDVGTFVDIIQPKLLDVLNASNVEVYCDDPIKAYPISDPWPLEYHGVHFYNFYRPGTPGIVFDYRTWLIGVEYVNNQPYLYGMVTIVWEP